MKPSQGKDKNSGVYGTPLEFLRPVNNLFPIWFDLAATAENNVVHRLEMIWNSARFFCEGDNSLVKEWSQISNSKWLWLNPPFSDIEPWAKKCAEESKKGARILLLVPQGSQAWNIAHCQGNALELRLAGRMTFDGSTAPYPKDLSLFVFGAGLTGTGFWDWR